MDISKAAAAMGRRGGAAGRGAAKARTRVAYRCETCDREITREEYGRLVDGEAMSCPEHPEATILSCPTPILSSERAREIRAQRPTRVDMIATAVEVACPKCGETQAAPGGSLFWTEIELIKEARFECQSCRAPLMTGVYEGDTLRLRRVAR